MSDYRQIIPTKELENRIKAFQQKMADQGLDGALILQKSDLFYFSGTTQAGCLYIPADHTPLFMVFKNFDRAVAESGLDRMVPLKGPKRIPDLIRGSNYNLPQRLGMELDILPADQYLMYLKIFKTSELEDVSALIRLQRAVKSEFEIDCIKKASALADEVSRKAGEFIREGMPEIELAALVEAHARKLGHQGLVPMRIWNTDIFYGHIMSGPSAAVPGCLASPTCGPGLNPFIGQGPGFSPIKAGEPILVDYVFALNGYLSDQARIFSIGPLPEDLVKAHEDMLALQGAAMKKAIPGLAAGDLYEFMVQMAGDMGYADYFMGGAEPRIRFTGHGLGIELDEFPFIAKGQTLALEPGMIVALEPKVVIPGKGVVGIENTFLVTKTGLQSLTRLSDDLKVI